MSQYGHPPYWSSRYSTSPTPFEWYQNYTGIRAHIHTHLKPSHKVLQVGGGNSEVAESMHGDGYHDLTTVDISPIVIEQMLERTARLTPSLTWLVMDVTSLEFPDESFDAVFDKGLLDTVLAGDRGAADAGKFLTGVSRILRPGGCYFCVSCGVLEETLPLLQNQDYSWTVEVVPVPKPRASEDKVKTPPAGGKGGEDCHYIYVCKTGGHDDEG